MEQATILIAEKPPHLIPVTGTLLERQACEFQVRPREWVRVAGAWVETEQGEVHFGPTVPVTEVPV